MKAIPPHIVTGVDANDTTRETKGNTFGLVPDLRTSNVRPEVPGGRIDRVHFSVSTRPGVTPGSAFLVNIWAHLEDQREAMMQRARQASEVPVIVQSKGPTMVARDVVLTVHLKLGDLVVEPSEDTILWDGEIGNAVFPVQVPKRARKGPRLGVATVYADGMPLARVDFVIQVVATAAPEQLFGEKRPYRSAFASYSSDDLKAVTPRLHGILKGAPGIKLFWDRHSLESGDRWEEIIRREIPSRDVFYLFWSEAASRSSWVEGEWRYALETRGIDYINPVPLVSPEEVPPPRELSGVLHFNDWILAYERSQRFSTDSAG